MPICLPILKLAAPTEPSAQGFKSGLLRSKANADWDQDMGYIRELYGQIASEWGQSHERGEALYQSAEPKLRELLLVLRSVMDAAPGTRNAVRDFETASSHASSGDYDTANQYLSYVLAKIRRQLDSGKAKVGYGYDISGESGRGGGTSGEGRHLWDTGNSPKHDHTQSSPSSMMFDAEAESDYPELAKFKHKRVHWPPRTR